MKKTYSHLLTVCFFTLGALFNLVNAQSTPFITRWDLSKTGGANTELSFGVATSGTSDASQIVDQFPYIIKDINTSGSNIASYPNNLANVNGVIYFAARDATYGEELWKTDGTAAGTVLVKDIIAGSSNSSPNNLTNVNGVLYFSARNATYGQELWKSDGTDAGTVLVKNINAGSGDAKYLTYVNGVLYFSAKDATNGEELWKTDGTTAGTVLVKDINAGSSSSSPQSLTILNGVIYFSAFDATNGRELWKTDGTAAGTVLVKDIYAGTSGSDLSNFSNINGVLYFSAGDATNGTELWKSDGTAAGTVLLKDIRAGTGSSRPSKLTNVNGVLYFSATDATNGGELWKTDGTTAGTVLVKDINAGTSDSSPSYFTNSNGVVYFTASDGINGRELWKTDGTPDGTVLIKDIGAGFTDGYLDYLTDVNGVLYFSAIDATNGRELWKTDGTPSGTVLVKDIYAGSSGSYPNASDPYFLINLGGVLYFRADDGAYGAELWKSDGTPAGTVLVKDINAGTDRSLFSLLTNINGVVYFTASDGTNGAELWKSDGTADGTVLVKDINAGSNSSDPSSLTNVGGVLYFSASDATNGSELWKTDGTDAGTVLVKDIRAGPNSSDLSSLTNVNGVLYFSAREATNGSELWKSDGTPAGTILVKDISAGTSDSNIYNLININGVLYFVADNITNGKELWKSDGTPAGTVLVKDIYAGISGSLPSFITNVNGVIYFSATDATNGTELWKTDGTTAGTVLVKDINAGTSSSNPSGFTNVNGVIYFSATDATNGKELWKTDGTPTGTVLVKDINAGNSASFPNNFTNVNGVIYFSATDATNGTELWKTDGTPDGTVLVKDISAGTSSSSPVLSNVNGVLYIEAIVGHNNFNYSFELMTLGHCTTANKVLPNLTTATAPSNSLYFNQQQQLSPASLFCHCDVFNNLISSVDATGASPISGTINSKVWIEATQPAQYVKRHYEISPATNATTATGGVTLYFTQQEFTDFNNQTPSPAKLLPTGVSDAAGKANFKIEKRGGVSTNGTGLPSTYTGTPEVIDPTESDIVWNATLSRWEVTFDAVGFGGFFAVANAITSFPTLTSFSPASGCVGSTVTITGTTLTGATAVTIGGTAVSSFVVNSATQITATVGSGTTGTISVTTPSGMAISSGTLTVNPKPAIPSISGATEICEGLGTTLSASSIFNTGGTITYGWTGGLSGNSIQVSPLTTRTYRVAATAEGCTSDSSAVFTLTVNPKPANPIITADNMSICKGGTAILTGSCSTANASFRWTTPPFNNGNQTSALPATDIRTITEPGVYKGLCESDKSCLSAEVSITITQATDCSGQNFITITPEKPVICPGIAITMTATGCAGTFTWLGGATQTGASVSLSPTATTTYLVNCSTGGSGSFTIVVAANTIAVGQNVSTGKERFKAVTTLTSDKRVGSATFTPGANVIYEAGNSITLLPGFTAEKWSIFKAEIKTCTN